MVLFRKIINIILLLCLLQTTNKALAQDGNPLQYLSRVSQSSRYNPAYQNKTDKLIIGLPLFSGNSFEWDANFSSDYIFTNGFSYSFEKFYQRLNEPGDAITTLTIPIFSLSYKEKNQTFGFSIADKILVYSNFDNEILNFIAQGLKPYYGNDDNFGPISLKLKIYREVGFSYAKQANKKLSLGFEAKVLFGKFYYEMEDLNVETKTLQSQNLLQIIPKGTYKISGPLSLTKNGEKLEIRPDLSPGDYLFKFKNMGIALDLGLTYEAQDQTTFSFSVIDLGFTTMLDNAYNITYNGTLDYKEESLYQSSDPAAPGSYIEPKAAIIAMTDSLPYISSAQAIIDRKYELLPIKINAQLSRQINKRMQIGVSDNFTYVKNNSDNFLAAFLYTTLGERFELATNIVCKDFEKIYPGLGFSYTAHSSQFYLSTNNIYRLLQPSSAKNINLCFGVNFLFSTQSK